MAESVGTAPIGTLLIFGASGDLTNRLLLPALGQLLSSPEGPETLSVVGSGSEAWDDATWRERVRAAFASVHAEGPRVDAILAETRYTSADVTKVEDLHKVLALCDGAPAIYFALPPAVSTRSCAAMKGLDLPAGTSLVLEKPFGTDEHSAEALNALLTALVPEARIHRVDHFLAKTTVLNILGLRFANRIFEPLWNADHIDRVDIVFDEPLALEDRARYYDGAGALVDMIQSHLLQVMAVVAMDPPLSMDARDLRDRKEEVMRVTKIWGGDPATSSRRARYTAGTIDGRELPAYVDEPGVDPARDTETLAEITLEIDSWRWPGVPFRLRSGKALADKRKEIVITFKPVPRRIPGLYGTAVPTQLVISLGPEKLSLDININGPEQPFELDREHLVAEFNAGRLPAYGEVLDAVFRGDPTLSVRGDTAEECWRIVDPVIAAWRAGQVPIDDYPAGSTGPAAWDDPSVPVASTVGEPATADPAAS